MSDTQGSLSLVNRRQEIIMFGAESRRSEVGHALCVTFGSFRHHGEFGGDGGQVVGSHRCTLDPTVLMRSGAHRPENESLGGKRHR